MKTILRLLAMALCLANLHAASLKLDGDLSATITEPYCHVELNGKVQNLGATTGYLKAVVWATPQPFPSRGAIIGEVNFGSLGAGFQFTNFKVKTPSKVPNVTGKYYLTVVLTEYTSTGWKSVLAAKSKQIDILAGNIKGQKKWKVPTKAVTAPPATLKKGNILKLRLRATSENNLYPDRFQEKPVITVTAKTKLQKKLAGKTQSATYKYAVKKGKLNKKSVRFAQVDIDYGKNGTPTQKNTLQLYFTGPKAGFYTSIDTYNSGAKDTSWGTFSFQ